MKSLEELQNLLGYQFGDRRVLLQSLTHTSYGHEFLQETPFALRDNERLEFLGDAILDVIISDILIERFPNANEGNLSKMRAAVVNEKTLASIARTIQLQNFIRLGKGECLTGGAEKASILSSTLEALIAALYLDGGFNAVYPVVRHLFSPVFGQEPEDRSMPPRLALGYTDHKTELQELVQARWKLTPTYHLIQASGPDHAKVFEVEVRMGDRSLGAATGTSKKIAEQNAAHSAYLNLTTPEGIIPFESSVTHETQH